MSGMSFYNDMGSDYANKMVVFGGINLSVPNNITVTTTQVAQVNIIGNTIQNGPYFFQITPNGSSCDVQDKADDINGFDPPEGLSCSCNLNNGVYAVVCSYKH
jgi:hypothetical protein